MFKNRMAPLRQLLVLATTNLLLIGAALAEAAPAAPQVRVAERSAAEMKLDKLNELLEKGWSPGATLGGRARSIDQANISCDQYQASLKAAREKPTPSTFDLGSTKVDNTPATRLELAESVRLCLAGGKADAVNLLAKDQVGGVSSLATTSYIDTLWFVRVEQNAKILTDEDTKNNFRGMSFGVGAGFSRSKGIESATTAADGTIRVTDSRKDEPRIILEAHYFGLCKLEKCRAGTMGIGPFFGIAPEGDSITAFAIGIMIGFKDEKTAQDGFSFGIGGVLDRSNKRLADGFVEGQPLPTGEATPVVVTRSKWSPLFFVTRTF